MAELPLVSVITPSFNQGKFLEDSLVSVANQTYPRIEHVVVDGGSTDGTLSLLRRYESRYDLRWRSESDAGQSDALNKGFAAARGEIIGWLNADDAYFARDAVEAVVRTFAQSSHTSVVYGDCAYISRAGAVFRVAPSIPQVSARRLREHSLVQPAVFFSRRVAQAYRLRQDLHYLMDYEYWLRLCRAEVFVHLEKIVAAYRIYGDSKSFKRASQAQEEWERVRQEYFMVGKSPARVVEVCRRRLVALGLRLKGFSRLPEVYQASLAFPGRRPPQWRLAIQQLILPAGVFARA